MSTEALEHPDLTSMEAYLGVLLTNVQTLGNLTDTDFTYGQSGIWNTVSRVEDVTRASRTVLNIINAHRRGLKDTTHQTVNRTNMIIAELSASVDQYRADHGLPCRPDYHNWEFDRREASEHNYTAYYEYEKCSNCGEERFDYIVDGVVT